ncbi:MAG: hypothetical protein SGPRY_006006 [Prymnesium sp.]
MMGPLAPVWLKLHSFLQPYLVSELTELELTKLHPDLSFVPQGFLRRTFARGSLSSDREIIRSRLSFKELGEQGRLVSTERHGRAERLTHQAVAAKYEAMVERLKTQVAK